MREVKVGTLHETVLQRMEANAVPQMDEVKPYRPEALADHPDTTKFYRAPLKIALGAAHWYIEGDIEAWGQHDGAVGFL